MSTVMLVLLAVTSVSLYAFVASQTQTPATYNLAVKREVESSQGAGVDLITLRCLNSTSGQIMRPQDVKFWLNRERPGDPDFKDEDYVGIDDSRKGIVFQLRVEGYYTCGRQTNIANVEESERVPLIALQTNFEDLRLTAVTRYFVAAGGTVQLHCPVRPRGLANYYYGQWKRDGTTIIEVLRPNDDGETADINKISNEIIELDRETFTLTLRSVNRTQASDNYLCVLHNLNPTNRNRQEFTQATFLTISLMVAEKPSVLKRPEPFIVGLQNATTNPPTFTCMVGGAPEPTLLWTYMPGLDETRSILLLDGDEYDIISNVTEQSNGLVVVTSTVTFLKVMNTDGGIVRCSAGSSGSYEDALLTVLGTADNIDVIVSRGGDVIYELEFPIEIQHPVTLNITYTSERGEIYSTIPDIRYINTSTISYKDTASELRFAVYYVSIALVGVDGNERIAGPSIANEQIIDTTKSDQITVIAISVGTVLGFVSIVLMNVVVITIVVCCIFPHLQKKLSLEYTQKVFDNPEEYTKYLKTEEDKRKFMCKVLKTHSKCMGVGRIKADDGGAEDEDIDDIDVFTQFLLVSAVEGLRSDNKYKTEFIEAVKRQVPTTPDKEQDEEPNLQPIQIDTEVEVEHIYHPGRDVSNDIEIEMSPKGARKNTGASRVIIETSENTTV